MKIKYKLNDDLLARAAAQLNFELCKLEGNIYIISNNRLINAKSIIGLLSGGLSKNDEIVIEIINTNEVDQVKEIFNEYGVYLGEELNGI